MITDGWRDVEARADMDDPFPPARPREISGGRLEMARENERLRKLREGAVTIQTGPFRDLIIQTAVRRSINSGHRGDPRRSRPPQETPLPAPSPHPARECRRTWEDGPSSPPD